ncbi:MAG: c-type cytochrome [Chitinophagaceae bacterium]|nr:c-type cytochrome [Chitinophagaceae bacterium]
MKKKALVITASIFTFALFAFVSKTSNQEPWPVPENYKNKINPIVGDAESIITGKSLYNTHCKSCHGTKGKGDGPKAAQLDTECGDFTKAGFKSQTDGSIYYKTEKGRKDMPSFKTKITETNGIWAIVNYIRTLK